MPLNSYVLNWSNGQLKAPITVAPESTNSVSTSLALIGQGTLNYGEAQQENMLRLLENFASGTEPANPTVGQLWYNTAIDKINVFDGTTWNNLAASIDTVNKQYVDNSPAPNIIVPPGTAADPSLFPPGLTGFDAYGSPDMPTASYWSGITNGVSGSPNIVRAFQMAVNWDNNGNVIPQHINFRVNDDTHDTPTWSNWRQVPWSDEVIHKSGGSMTGALTLAADPTSALGAATKQYVDSAINTASSGAPVNGVFYENDQIVNSNYTVPAGKNAMSAGPISVANGVTVTVSNGSVWTVV